MFYLIVKKEHVHFIYYNLAKYALPYSKNAIVVVNENNYFITACTMYMYPVNQGIRKSLLHSRVSPLLFMFMADYSCQHFAISEMVLIISIHKKGDECLAPLKSYSSTTNFVEIQRVSFERKKGSKITQFITPFISQQSSN